MKRNRLHIQYNASTKSPLIKQDEIESMRCTNIDRAKEIVSARRKEIVKAATFKDASNTTHKIA